MTESPAALVTEAYAHTHRQALGFLQRLSDEQLRWHPSAETHSIAFHAWHLARWADHLQAATPGMTPGLGQRLGSCAQVWHAEGLADRWGFDPSQLGYAETGMDMADDVAVRLPFPAKDELLSYVGRAFGAAIQAVTAIDDQQFQLAEQPQPITEGIWGGGTVGDAVMSHVTHANRHLGMMECLLGLQGRPGTATH